MTPQDFAAGVSYLLALRPGAYVAAELRLWTYSQLAEELAAVAMQEDPAP